MNNKLVFTVAISVKERYKCFLVWAFFYIAVACKLRS